MLTVITTLSKNLQWLPTDSACTKATLLGLAIKPPTPWAQTPQLSSPSTYPSNFKLWSNQTTHISIDTVLIQASMHLHTQIPLPQIPPTKPTHPPSYFSPQISAPASALLCLVCTTSLGGIRNRLRCLSALCTQSFHAAPHRDCILGFTHQPTLLDQELPEAHPCSFILNTNTKIRPNITLSKHMVND